MSAIPAVRRFLLPEVAERLRTSTRQVLRMISTGDLRAINCGLGKKRPRWVIDQSDLEEFERRRSTGPATKVPSKRRAREAVPNYFG